MDRDADRVDDHEERHDQHHQQHRDAADREDARDGQELVDDRGVVDHLVHHALADLLAQVRGDPGRVLGVRELDLERRWQGVARDIDDLDVRPLLGDRLEARHRLRFRDVVDPGDRRVRLDRRAQGEDV